MNKPVVIIPTYNEIDNVRQIADAVMKNLEGGDVLFVDDNSPDGTGKVADEMAAANPRVHVLHRPGKQGLGRAYIAGFKWALENGYTHIFEMDADFSHDPAELPNFMKASEEADLILGSRYIGGIRVMNWPLSRLLISTFGGVYVRAITGLPIMDPTGGFKCFRRVIRNALCLVIRVICSIVSVVNGAVYLSHHVLLGGVKLALLIVDLSKSRIHLRDTVVDLSSGLSHLLIYLCDELIVQILDPFRIQKNVYL